MGGGSGNVTSVEERISNCDITLFDHIESQTTAVDRESLLAIQAACRETSAYVYLEVGSHLGGSLQPHVVDPRCRQIISIDPRPEVAPDERGIQSRYGGNSTERMMRNLAAIPDADLQKVHNIDASTSELSAADLPARPDLCFIDGEHTDEAVLRDARFCLDATNGQGCIAFHDAHVLYRPLIRLVRELSENDVEHASYFLPHAVFLIELGAARLQENRHVQRMVLSNSEAYLWALNWNDRYWSDVRKQLARGVPVTPPNASAATAKPKSS